jgi:hypothetical protein
MKWAAPITWLLTAGGGLVLLRIRRARGDMRQEEELLLATGVGGS